MAYYKKGRTTPCLRSALRSPALGLYSQCLCRKVALQIGVGAQRVELSLGQAIEFNCRFYIGARCACPTLVVKTENIYMVHVYSVYTFCPIFVRNTIFPHCTLVDEATVAQETRLARQKG